MHDTILFLGFATGAVLVLMSLWVLGSLALSLVATFSWLRWRFAVCRTHNIRVQWTRIPGAMWRQWVDFTPYRKGRLTMQSLEGSWHGIGNWSVTPREILEAREASHAEKELP